jgi:hypothetical protein
MGAMSIKFSGKAPRIQHREYIGPILAPSAPADFNTSFYPIQPGFVGAGSLFPWGASVFGSFEQYVLHGMVLEYVSTSSNYAPGGGLGSVSMSTVYDAEAPVLSTLLAVNNNEFTTSANPSVSFYHPIECAPNKGATDVKYVRKQNSSALTDTRFDDVGIFQISTAGLSAAAGTQIGELWASYDIELLKSVLPDIHIGTTAVYDLGTAADVGALATSIVPNPQNSLPAKLTGVRNSALSGTYTLALPGQYNGNYFLLIIFQAGPGFSWTVPTLSPFTVGADISPILLMPTSAGPSSASTFNSNNSTTQLICGYSFSSIAEAHPASDNSLSFTFSVASQTGTSCANIYLLPLDNDVSDASTMLARLFEKDPKMKMLAQMVSKYQGPSSIAPVLASTPQPRSPEPCDFPTRNAWLEYLASVHELRSGVLCPPGGSAATCASSSAPSAAPIGLRRVPISSYYESGSGHRLTVVPELDSENCHLATADCAPASNPVLTRVRGTSNVDDLTDNWTTVSNTPVVDPSTSAAALKNQQAEDQLAAAIDAAAAARRGTSTGWFAR